MSLLCRSWRPGRNRHDPGHPPGTCRACWSPCLRWTQDGQPRCPSCLDLLVAHPDRAVRIALANEPDLTQDVLLLLATDPDVLVRTAATNRVTIPKHEPFYRTDDEW